jgi:hypothetical protein
LLWGTGLALAVTGGLAISYLHYISEVYRSYRLSADLYDVEDGFFAFKRRYDATREMFVDTEGMYWNDLYNRRVVNPELAGHGWGFHGEAPALVPSPGTTRILCVGSSTVWNGFPHDLQALLDERAPGDFEVIDAGIPGASLINLFMNYALLWSRFSPDIVALEYNLDQLNRHRILPFEINPEYDALVGPEFGFERVMGFHPKLPARRLARAMVRIDEPQPDDLLGYRVSLESFVDLIEGSGAQPVLLTQQPTLSQGGANHDFSEAALKRYTGHYYSMFMVYELEGAIAAIDAQNEIMREIADERELTLVDVVGMIPREDRYYADATHLAEPGTMIVAHELLDRMTADGLISP